MTDWKMIVVGDPHACHKYDNVRFDWLGRYIAATLPNTILVTGDWGDYPSVFSRGKPKDLEGLRLTEDIAAHHDSLVRVEKHIAKVNEGRKRAHLSRYNPTKIYLLGNHEDRVAEVERQVPSLVGSLDGDVLEPFIDAGWECVPYGRTRMVHGFACCHHLPSGNMGRPIGGANLARSLLKTGYQSAIVGHDHRYMEAHDRRWDGSRVHAFSAGCFVHPDYDEPWSRQVQGLWDKGLLLLDGVSNGDFTKSTWITMTELKRRYGGRQQG